MCHEARQKKEYTCRGQFRSRKSIPTPDLPAPFASLRVSHAQFLEKSHNIFFQLLASVTRKPKASLERPKQGKGLPWRIPALPMEVHPSKPDTPLPDPAPRQALEATQPLLPHALPPQQGEVSNMRRVLRDGGPVDLEVATALTAEGGVGSRQGLVHDVPHPVAASRGEAAAVHPLATAASTAEDATSNAFTTWPSSSTLSAIGSPIAPRPIKPTRSGMCAFDCGSPGTFFCFLWLKRSFFVFVLIALNTDIQTLGVPVVGRTVFRLPINQSDPCNKQICRSGFDRPRGRAPQSVGRWWWWRERMFCLFGGGGGGGG